LADKGDVVDGTYPLSGSAVKEKADESEDDDLVDPNDIASDSD
jgi:hypothetical protein